jgi:hypothetical protein
MPEKPQRPLVATGTVQPGQSINALFDLEGDVMIFKIPTPDPNVEDFDAYVKEIDSMVQHFGEVAAGFFASRLARCASKGVMPKAFGVEVHVGAVAPDAEPNVIVPQDN